MGDRFLIVAFMMFVGLTAGCVASHPLRQDIYPTAPPAVKVPARVTLVRWPGPPESVQHKVAPYSTAEIDLRGYPPAVYSMLGSLYTQVSIATSAAEGKNADLIVLISTDYPKSVGLTFENSAGTVVSEFLEPGFEVPSSSPQAENWIPKILTPPAMIVSLGTLGFGLYYIAHQSAEQLSKNVSDATLHALSELRQRIAATPALMAAMLPANVTFAAFCPKPITAYQPPQEARVIFERGQDYLKLAQSVEDYGTAAAELEKAVALAPCWSSAVLSSAMAEEASHQWKRAASHLRTYLELNGDTSEATELRAKIADFETRPPQSK